MRYNPYLNDFQTIAWIPFSSPDLSDMQQSIHVDDESGKVLTVRHADPYLFPINHSFTNHVEVMLSHFLSLLVTCLVCFWFLFHVFIMTTAAGFGISKR